MNSVLRKSLLWPVLVALVYTTAIAGDRNRVGTAGGQELMIPVGAAGVGLGGSSIAFASGVDALYWNPAGLAKMTNSAEATFSQMSYIADIGVSYGAVGFKAGSIGEFALSMKSIAFGDIPVTTDALPDGTGETYSPTFVNIGLTYANALSDKVDFGGTITVISEQIQSTSASAVAFSGGIQYNGIGLQGLHLGVAVKNVGSKLNFSGSNLLVQATSAADLRPANYLAITTAPAELPTTLEVGLAYLANVTDSDVLTLGGNFQNNNFDDDEWKLGGEYNFENTVFLRGGYSFAPTSTTDSGLDTYQYDYSFGVGVRLDLGGAIANVDYGYRHLKTLSANNVISVTLGF
ncbi:MAG TPA: PorV/PorQ family protein [Bacteroidota bacterium]|nr:PorV/PorQ family protein [Bacteroidota bacterium]